MDAAANKNDTSGKIHKDTDHPCQICGKTMNSSLNLKRHITFYHRNPKKPVSCQGCGKQFLTQAYKDRHTEKHCKATKPKKNDNICPVCNKVFSDKVRGGLVRHIREVHKLKTEEEIKASTCGICNKVFTNPKVMLSHQKIIHTEDAKAKCPM